MFQAKDVARAFESAVAEGAAPLTEPYLENEVAGNVCTARIGVCGDLVHTLADKSANTHLFSSILRYRGEP